ncbi:hypothetical protein P154DRAFT_571262 [Amniculicola lignicola CBS 123094]|uniref:EKC/KEOPS complex subunit GON7 n=1 Tax=Amniculicola lignicola CBS 123094 TaxID=1392246 RepID=A0A6A5X281_9PLEO|nr:hypothetical protein P154DRAFT_571262 [Amniculicola lignicola CBS 123094]
MPSVEAVYTSPITSSPVTISSPTSLPTISSSPSTEDRVAYLAKLQTSIKTLQADVNAFLTQKMEDDKAAAGKIDDAKEEENYGEEVILCDSPIASISIITK